MQEQLEIHDDLVKSVYRHSVSTLNLVAELISTRGADAIDESAGEILQASVNRVDALVLLEECLYYQSELLLADLNKYTNILVSRLLKQSCLAEENIITINEVTAQPFPVEQASLLAVVLFELIENAIHYAFDETDGANYLHIVLQTDKSADSDTTFRLVVQDNGPGIPPNIDPLSAQTAGLSIVASMATKLGGDLRFASNSGTVVSIRFPRAGAL
jgi:two-component sensor histidine kinase